jgi:hypothetical protein
MHLYYIKLISLYFVKKIQKNMSKFYLLEHKNKNKKIKDETHVIFYKDKNENLINL